MEIILLLVSALIIAHPGTHSPATDAIVLKGTLELLLQKQMTPSVSINEPNDICQWNI